MNRQDWLLLFMSREPLNLSQGADLDPIRIQKGMFLLSKRGPARDLYTFRPYNWGPFSREIYQDLESLEAAGLVEAERAPGRTWRLYRTTSSGEQRAAELAANTRLNHVSWLAETRSFVTDRSFVRLLRDIYNAYPEYRARSLLQG